MRFLNVEVAEEKALLEAKVQELQLEWYLVLGLSWWSSLDFGGWAWIRC